jgi:hypothetical protein
LVLSTGSIPTTAQVRTLAKAEIQNQLIGRSGIIRTNLGAKLPTTPVGIQSTFTETFDGISGITAVDAETDLFPPRFSFIYHRNSNPKSASFKALFLFLLI